MIVKLAIVFFLGFSSGLPLCLISSTLQAWFAQDGLSLWFTGSLSLVGLPYLYRALWSPLLDRYYLSRFGRRRTWMMACQILLCLGFWVMSYLNPQDYPYVMMILAFLLAVLSSSQDSVIDAQRLEYLPKAWHGMGATLAVSGYRIALMLSGGAALVMAQYWGFSATYKMMALVMSIGLITSLLSKEPRLPYFQASPTQGWFSLFWQPFRELLGRSEFLTLFAFIVFFKMGEAFTASTSGIVMPFLIQGMGFSLETIGYVNKIIGVIAVLLGGAVAGIWLLRYSLSRALLYFGLAQAATNALFCLLAYAGPRTELLIAAVFCDNFAVGLGSTALVALFMRLVMREYSATQFSILVAIASLPRVFSGPLAASIQHYVGWLGLYQIAFLLAFAFIPFWKRLFAEEASFQRTLELRS